jgi:hypothetical protein
MSLSGTYDCMLKTPLGDKSGSLIVVPSADGASFTGTLSNAMLGTVEIADGTIDGDMLLCSLDVSQPTRMTVSCEMIVDGDSLNGFVKAGMFGEMKLTGTRA